MTKKVNGDSAVPAVGVTYDYSIAHRSSSSTVTSYLRRKFQQNLISDYVKKQYWKMGANFDNFY